MVNSLPSTFFPRIKGGDDSFDNIAYACKKCNSSKGDKDLIEWMYETKEIIPSFEMVCIYMKLVYKFSMEHNLMPFRCEDLNQMTLPFNYQFLINIEKFIKEDYLNIYKELEDG